MRNRFPYQEEAGGGAPAGGPAAPAAPAAEPAPAAPVAAPAAPAPSPAAPAAEGNWRDNLPDEVKGSESLSKFESVSDLSQAYLNLEKHTGNAIRIPGEDASPEARQDFIDKLQKNAPQLMVKPDPENADAMKEFYQTLGQPTDPKQYEIPEYKDDQGNVLPLDMSQAEAFRDIAMEANLTKAQYSSIVDKITQSNMAAEMEQQTAFIEQAKALRTEWGQAYDDRYRQAAEVAAKTDAPEQLLEMFKTGWVDSSTIKYFHSLAQRFAGEGNEIKNQGSNGPDANAPAEAQEKINEILNNKKHAYWDAHHPEHKAAIAKMVNLQKEANPDAGTDINALRAGGWGGQ